MTPSGLVHLPSQDKRPVFVSSLCLGKTVKERAMKNLPLVLMTVLTLSFSLPSFAQNQPQPATLRSILLHELETTHNKADWFVPITVAVDGLTPEQANWQPKGDLHSSGQLTYHLLFWNRLNLERLQGKSSGNFTGKNDETFDKFDEKQWNDTVKQLDQVMTDLENLVKAADDKKLASIATTIANICTHNAYHVGQIVYVRKLQGSWNPAKGVQ
jgi:DinB superfamily